MNQRIVIVFGQNISHLAAMLESMSLQSGEPLTVLADEAVPVRDIAMQVANCSTNFSECLKEMCRAAEELNLIETGHLDGIQELRDWFQNKVHQIIGTFGVSRRQHRLPIFQPCWSARRWKSLT